MLVKILFNQLLVKANQAMMHRLILFCAIKNVKTALEH